MVTFAIETFLMAQIEQKTGMGKYMFCTIANIDICSLDILRSLKKVGLIRLSRGCAVQLPNRLYPESVVSHEAVGRM